MFEVIQMKKFALIALLFLFGCVGITSEQILKEAIETSQQISNYRLDYNVNMTVGNETMMVGVTTYKKDHSVRMDGMIEGFEFRSYTRNNKTSVCANANETWYCQDANETGYDFEKFGVVQFMEKMNESMAKNALNLSKKMINTKIAGRECKQITGSIDMGKMGGEGVSNIVECLDVETGFPLLYVMETTSEGEKIRMDMLVTSLKINEVNESVFEMPA